uniref:Uncharacterized protein n=1 Tax=Aegilops tauschii subsp. strangulata TaxID=200361 RepID=A0A453HBD1_AEGTS
QIDREDFTAWLQLIVLLFSHIFQRRDAVYKRNYKDYFGFMEGPVREKPAEELTESEKGILAWLDKNK